MSLGAQHFAHFAEFRFLILGVNSRWEQPISHAGFQHGFVFFSPGKSALLVHHLFERAKPRSFLGSKAAELVIVGAHVRSEPIADVTTDQCLDGGGARFRQVEVVAAGVTNRERFT
jgi:hypothetical protein